MNLFFLGVPFASPYLNQLSTRREDLTEFFKSFISSVSARATFIYFDVYNYNIQVLYSALWNLVPLHLPPERLLSTGR